MKKTLVVDIVLVNSVRWAEGGKGVKGAKAKGWDSCYQTRDGSGWEFITTIKKLALQVSRGSLLFFARGQ